MTNLPQCVALDFETSGSSRGVEAEPWQLGMVRMVDGTVDATSQFETRMSLPPLPPVRGGRVGEIAPTYTVGAGELVSRWPELKPWWTDTPLAAHNIATEKNLLERVAPLHHFGPWIDTLTLSKCAYPTLSSYALGDVCEQLSLLPKVESICPDRSAHDALYDAVACAVLLEHLIHLPAWAACTLDDLVHMKPKTYYRTRKKSR